MAFFVAVFNAGLLGSVTLLFPDDGEELTDIAVSFKARITDAGPYYLYVSRNSDFTGEVIRRPAQTGKGEIVDNIQYFLTYQGTVTPWDRFVLTPGTWYWRVSGDGGNTFSETRTLHVNNSRPLTPPEWEIGPNKPLFHMRLRSQVVDHAPNGDIGAALKKIIPDELKEYIVLDIGHSFSFLPKHRSLFEYSRIFDDLGYKYFFDMGSHAWLGRIASLGEMEKVFRDLDHCVGASTPEIFYYIYDREADRSMMDGALELCRKYGKKFLMADMNWKWAKWQYFNYLYYDIFQERSYADYYIPQFKTTDPWGAYTNISSIQGMKLSGMVRDMGIWADWWCWEKFGQVNKIELEGWLNGTVHGNETVYPFMQNIKQFIYGITFGSTVFALESNLQWHWLTAEPNDHYYRYLQPFIQAVIDERLIPSPQSINRNFNIIVDTEFDSEDIGTTAPLTYMEGNIWGDFLRSTYGIADLGSYKKTARAGGELILQSAFVEMIPNSDRYPSGIPFLPKPGIEIPEVNGQPLEVVKLSALDSKEKANVNLNPYYPESTNEAYARKIDSSIFVFNTMENHDIRQSYGMGVQFAGIDSLMGEIDLMSYVVGRCRPDGKTLFFQTNAYVRNPATWNSNGGKYELPNYPTVLNFKCQLEPTLSSDNLPAITRQEWDPETGMLTLEIDHTAAGAVNFTLTGDPAIQYTADSISLDQEEAEVRVSEHIQLQGRVFPDTLRGISLTWRSLNPNIAAVTAGGLVTGKGEGTVEIVAQINNFSDTVTCTVSTIPLDSFRITTDTIVLFVGEDLTIPVSLEPPNATDIRFVWTSKNSYVASVNSSGTITASSEGATYVTALHEETGLLDSCLVRVRDRLITGIDLGMDTVEMQIGDTYWFHPDITPTEATDQTIVWTIDPSGVVWNYGDGRFLAYEPGTVTVYAENLRSGVRDSCMIVVAPVLANQVTLNTSFHEFEIGETFQFEATIDPPDTSDPSIEWESGAEEIVTISAEGLATAMSAGETFISGFNQASGISDTCRVTVKVPVSTTSRITGESFLYPNPVKRGTPIRINSPEKSTFVLIHTSGSTTYISEGRSTPVHISTEELVPGIYVLHVLSGTHTSVTRVIITP